VRRLLLATLALLLLAAPAALAQDPVPTTPTAPPPPPPAPAKISLAMERVGHVGTPVVLQGRSFHVVGTVTPYVAGQRVHVRFVRGGRIVHTADPAIEAALGGKVGRFRVAFAPKAKGRLRVGVTHAATPEMAFARAGTPTIEVIGAHAGYGSSGRTVLVMQRILRRSGYVPGRPGVYDSRTARAVLAFRKMSNLPRTFTATAKVMHRIINGGGRFDVRFPHQGRHAEGDLTHQVLALIDGRKVERLYAISSGKPSTPTVLGTYRIYQRTPGMLPDGMYYSSFFIRGYAIHGYDPSPTYPASHGCLRTPIEDAISIYNWLAYGDYVDTYYRSGHHRHPKPSANAGP
jgi:hypothetical protein